MKVNFDQVAACNAVVLAAVIDKHFLQDHMTHETQHKKAYEFMLGRIEHLMADYHPKHNPLIVMDDTSKDLNQAVAMKHAYSSASAAACSLRSPFGSGGEVA